MNFQNIPRSNKVIKQAFVPKLDALMFFDYRQIEPRILAYFLDSIGDDTLASRLRSGEDTYTAVVREIYKKDTLTDEERQTGKVLFLSLMYGGGTPTVIKQFGVDYLEAKRMTNQFHDAWPGIRKLQGMIDHVRDTRGYITTPWGRHLHTEEAHKRLNALIQGSAADLMRYALVNTSRMLRDGGYKSHLISTVHDELQLDCVMEEVPQLAQTVPVCMDFPLISSVVPVLTDIEISTTTWADKSAYEEVTVA